MPDQGNDRIQAFTPDGAYLVEWGGSGSGDGQFSHPPGIAFGPGGDSFVLDKDNARVQKFGQVSTATLPGTWGGLKRRFR